MRQTCTNPLLARRLFRSPELDRERRRAGKRLTQNLSCWNYLIGVNHRIIVSFPPDVFQRMLDSQRFLGLLISGPRCHIDDAEKFV